MPSRSSQHHFEVPAPSGVVAAVLLDPQTFARIHPLIDRVVETGRRDEDGVEIVAFEVFEHVPLGPLRIPNRYPAQMRCTAENRIEVLARSEPGITVRTVFTLRPRGQSTTVEENMEVTAPWWLLGFVAATAEKAHAQQGVALVRLFPGPATSGSA